MSKLGPARKPYEIISIDTVGGFGNNRSAKKYMHILVDMQGLELHVDNMLEI